MTLRLISSGDDRACAIRDHLMPLVRRAGTLEVQRDAVRLLELRMGTWVFRHWTPFNALSDGDASSPSYRHAVERQHTRPDLPYGLEVSRPRLLLRILWSDTGMTDVQVFIRGAWEDDALAL